MAKMIGKLTAPRGKYTDKETGEEKTSWGVHGVVLETEKGLRVKLESLPLVAAGEDGIWFSVFQGEKDERPKNGSFRDSKPRSKNGSFRDSKPQQEGFEDDDIAF